MKPQNSVSTDIAMIWLCTELHEAADKGHVILLVDAWERYKKLAEKSQTTIQQSYYSKSTTLKEKLQLTSFSLSTRAQPSER